MDLRSIINADSDNSSARRQASATPVTPVQPNLPPQAFPLYHGQPRQASPSNRAHNSVDYGSTPSPQASLGNHSQYYGHPQTGSGSGSGSGSISFPSPTAYQRPPPPPPIQAQHNFHSPAGSYSAHSAQSAQSPYRQTPTSSLSNSQYPFPMSQTPQSPAHHQQYPSPQLQHHPSQIHTFVASATIPQTPPTPIGIPGSAHPYLHRSQSSLSAMTPTSAHSQSPYFNQPITPSVPAPENRRPNSAREQSMSVSPKTQPAKRKLGEMGESPENIHKRKSSTPYTNGNTPKVSPNSDTRVPNSARPSTNGDTPPPKRRRYAPGEKPIWAQSWKTWKGNPGKQAASALIDLTREGPVEQVVIASNHVTPPIQAAFKPLVNTLTGKQPQDPLIKAIADFLYANVVGRNDWGEIDSLNKSRGLVLEVEAKLGHIIDRQTNLRYIDGRIGSQCIFDGGPTMAFRSNMTVVQHKALNEFLNKQVQDALPQNPARKPGRVPIDYKHIHQVDKFYELPRNAISIHLPPVLMRYHNPNHILKVRVTHDKVSKAIITKIIKGRIQDLSIYNPTGLFDCRISINFEIDYDGGMDELQVGVDQQPDRYKDRLSYTQSHYQVDLTKVETTINGVSQGDNDHELEIEVSSNALREHGIRAANGQPNEYIEIVQNLVDNIRLLDGAAAAA